MEIPPRPLPDVPGIVMAGQEDESWTPLKLTPEQVAEIERQNRDCLLYGQSFSKVTFDESAGAFGLAPIKIEGVAVEYDPTRPQFPPETWRDRLRWRLKRAKYRIRHLMGMNVP